MTNEYINILKRLTRTFIKTMRYFYFHILTRMPTQKVAKTKNINNKVVKSNPRIYVYRNFKATKPQNAGYAFELDS